MPRHSSLKSTTAESKRPITMNALRYGSAFFTDGNVSFRLYHTTAITQDVMNHTQGNESVAIVTSNLWCGECARMWGWCKGEV